MLKAEGARPLHLAACAVRVRSPSFGFKDFPIPHARGGGEVVNVLLKARADVNAAARDGKTALHVSALRGCLEAVQLLLDAGSDKN